MIAVFAFGEGETEGAFLKHLRSTYGRNTGIKVRIDNGSGKTPEVVVKQAIKLSTSFFDRRFVLIDTDVPWTDSVKKLAKSHKIELIGATPCIEGFLLSLLEPKRDISVLSSQRCKDIFEKKYLSAKEKLDYTNYKKFFAIKKLGKFLKKNAELSRMISLMTQVKL